MTDPRVTLIYDGDRIDAQTVRIHRKSKLKIEVSEQRNWRDGLYDIVIDAESEVRELESTGINGDRSVLTFGMVQS
jgi:hypothetical protein